MVEEAQALLRTRFEVYENKQDGAQRVGCDEYSVPKDVYRHIDYIAPTIQIVLVVQKTDLAHRVNF
jgi:tripeptidyl-peptidase-1